MTSLLRKKPLIFIGARASGKSTLSRLVAEHMGWEFCDTDDYIQARVGMSIADFVEQHGWESFRHQESVALRTVCTERTVIATGGGCILAKKNREFMRAQGFVCYLEAPEHVLIQRLRTAPNASMRPALTHGSLVSEVTQTLRRRSPLYKETAHMRMDAQLPLPHLTNTIYRMLTGSMSARTRPLKKGNLQRQ